MSCFCPKRGSQIRQTTADNYQGKNSSSPLPPENHLPPVGMENEEYQGHQPAILIDQTGNFNYRLTRYTGLGSTEVVPIAGVVATTLSGSMAVAPHLGGWFRRGLYCLENVDVC